MRPTTLVAWAIAATCVAVTFGALVLLALTIEPRVTFLGSAPLDAMFAIGLLAFPVLGALVASRLPRNPIGWLFCLFGLNFAVLIASQSYAAYSFQIEPSGRLVGVTLWLVSWGWVPGMGLFLGSLLLFPTGRLPGRRWRVVVAILAAAAVVELVAYALGPDPALAARSIEYLRPIRLGPDETWTAAQRIGDVLLAVAMLLVAASLLFRFRRARGVERQQLKWIAYATLLLAVGTSAITAVGPTATTGLAAVPVALAFMAVPVAAAIAVLRYRLYDIDVLINRTLVYGLVSGSLALSYLAAVLILQSALRPFTAGSEIAVAGSTLVVVALFQPVRRRAQELVDRAFYRSRVDAARTLEAFSVRLRDEVDLDAIRDDLLGVVDQTVRPRRAGVWLRGGPR